MSQLGQRSNGHQNHKSGASPGKFAGQENANRRTRAFQKTSCQAGGLDITESAIESFLSSIGLKRGRTAGKEVPLVRSSENAHRTSDNPQGLRSGGSTSEESKKSLFMNAISAYKAMEYEDALILFKRLLMRDPSQRSIYGMLGTTFYQNGMLSEAISVFEAMKRMEPRDPAANENLGYIYCVCGNFEAAAREWQLLQAFRPDKANWRDRLEGVARLSASRTSQNDLQNKRLDLIVDGIGYYRKQNYDLAIRAFKLASLITPESTAYSLLGNAYFRNDMIQESVHALENAISFDGRNVFAFESLGQVYSRQGAIDQAIDTWEKILEMDPERDDIVKRIDDLIAKDE